MQNVHKILVCIHYNIIYILAYILTYPFLLVVYSKCFILYSNIHITIYIIYTLYRPYVNIYVRIYFISCKRKVGLA